MKRVAFTIIFNGIKHLQHNNYYNKLSSCVDLWVIIEGLSLPNGSTSWCKEIDDDFHNNFLSRDGTTEFLNKNRKENVIVIRPENRPWLSKDEQVNAGIRCIKERYIEAMLWQIDIDEQWTEESMSSAENELIKHNGKTGCFRCDYFVGPNQQVFGEWGENTRDPYRRLWHWQSEDFETHEPPKLQGNNGPRFLLPQRFKHYSYYFEEDVIFKERYYSSYEGLHRRWLDVQKNTGTLPVRSLLGDNVWWSNTNTIIQYTGHAC